MARTFIKIDVAMPGATHSGLLRGYVQQQRNAYEVGSRIKAIMTNNHDGTDFTDLEALFGLEAGDGQAVFDLINGTIGANEGTFQNNNGKTIGEVLG